MTRNCADARISTFGRTSIHSFMRSTQQDSICPLSGGVGAVQHPQIRWPVVPPEPGDMPVVTTPDRLGRDPIQVANTFAALNEIPVRVYCPAPRGTDVTRSAGCIGLGCGARHWTG